MCELACKTKIIINGGNAANLIEQSCEALQFYFNAGGEFPHDEGEKLIMRLNLLENDAVELQKAVLKAIGYNGPVGKMLT